MHSFWGDSQGGSHHYGGGAPDWLDEAAAISLEDAEMTAGRREAFRELAAEGRIPSLAQLLALEHPLARIAAEAAARRGAEGGDYAMMVGEAEAEEMFAAATFDPPSFYAIVRGFLDFLSEPTGNISLAEITAMLDEGESFETWLAEHGADYGLADNLADLETDWAAWAAAQQPI
jgi:hypothetical protein